MDHVTMNHATLNGIASRANPPSGRRQTGVAAMADAPVAYPPYVPSTVEGFCRRAGKRSASASAAPRQRGAVLVVALIFLLLLSILAVSVMRSGQLEVLMAGNSQAQLSAFEFAEGVSESILARRSSNLNSNAVICGTCTSSSTTCSASFFPTPSDPAFTCSTTTTLALDDRLKPAYTGTGALVAIKNATIQGRVRPLNEGKPSCVPSFVPPVYGLADAYAIFFDVEASYDNSVSRQGASRVNQGVVWVIPGQQPTNCAAPRGKLDDIAHTVTGPTGI